MLLNGGKYGDTRILSRKAVDLISHNIITAEQAKTFNWDSCIGYGYGGLMRTLINPEITMSAVQANTAGTAGRETTSATIPKTILHLCTLYRSAAVTAYVRSEH